MADEILTMLRNGTEYWSLNRSLKNKCKDTRGMDKLKKTAKIERISITDTERKEITKNLLP